MGFGAGTFRSSVARRHHIVHRRRRAVVVAHVPQTLPATATTRFRGWRHVLLHITTRQYYYCSLIKRVSIICFARRRRVMRVNGYDDVPRKWSFIHRFWRESFPSHSTNAFLYPPEEITFASVGISENGTDFEIITGIAMFVYRQYRGFSLEFEKL